MSLTWDTDLDAPRFTDDTERMSRTQMAWCVVAMVFAALFAVLWLNPPSLPRCQQSLTPVASSPEEQPPGSFHAC